MKRNLKLLLLPAVFMLPAICGPAWAIELVAPVDFTLTPGGGYNNQLSMTINIQGMGSDSETTTATGGLRANLYLDYDPLSHAATVTGIGFAMQNPPPGNIALTDMHFSYYFGLVKIDMTGLRGDLDTQAPPVPVTSGQFPFPSSGAGHYMTINAGMITATGVDPINLAVDPIYSRITGSTPGTITLSGPYNIVGPQASFDATLLAPIYFSEVVSDGPPQVTATGSGTLRGVGSFTVVPEPSSLLLLLAGLSGLLCYGWRRR